jgi:hypothetical protein
VAGAEEKMVAVAARTARTAGLFFMLSPMSMVIIQSIET